LINRILKSCYTAVLVVTTATRATDALRILREKEDEINLILIETRLPDMNQYEILETLGELSSLPIVGR
jgi:two-component response regulator (ARR-B family)